MIAGAELFFGEAMIDDLQQNRTPHYAARFPKPLLIHD